MDQPLSPLEPLDPHRLRDMVVDKQAAQSASTSASTAAHQMAHQWTFQQSPASSGSPHSAVTQRLSTSSVEMSSPFQPSSQQPPTSHDFNLLRTSMYQQPSGSPTKPMAQQHMMSPQHPLSNHPPASPFARSSSAASNCSSPFPQQPQMPPQYPGSPMYAPPTAYTPPTNVRLPPSYPNNSALPQYVTYSNPPAQQWPPQNVHPQYPNQPAGQRMMSPHAGVQRPPMTRVPYMQQGYPGMPPPNMLMFPPRASRQPPVQYPQTPSVSSSPQTPVASTTPTANLPFPGPYPTTAAAQHYYVQQQQRLQQTHQQSPIRSPFLPGHPNIPQPPTTPIHPDGDRAKMAVHFGPQQHSGPQTPSTPVSQTPVDHGPPVHSSPHAQLQHQQSQQRLAHGSSSGTTVDVLAGGVLTSTTPVGPQVPIMRSPPLVSPAQAQMPTGQQLAMIHQGPQIPPQAPSTPQQPIHHLQLQQQQSVEMTRRLMHQPPTPGTPIAGGPRNGAPTAIFQQRMPGGVPIMQRLPSGVPGAPRMRVPQYYGPIYHANQMPTPDTFLAGCCFVIEELNVPGGDKHELEARLRYYGAEVEHSLSAIHEPPAQSPYFAGGVLPPRVTHVLCDSLTMKIRQQVLRFTLPQRLVTSHWLSDALVKKKVEPPTRASHLPTPWVDEKLPGVDKLITAEGFTESEVGSIRAICKAIGARFTTYLTRKHAALISKTGEGKKAERTKEWKIPILNYAWLVRLYFGNVQVINEINRDVHKPSADPQCLVDSTPYVLERMGELTLKLLVPWRNPIVVTDEALRLATRIREKTAADISIFPHKKLKDPLSAPTDEQIAEATRILTENGRLPDVRVFLDGLPVELNEPLMRKARFMGGQAAESIIACTHFVTTSLKRTPALLEALGRGKEVVDPAWINHSFSRVHFVDSYDFHVRDAENERKFRFSALNTIFRARERAIFEDMTFHLSPSVLPSFDVLRSLIEAGGGVVEQQKPKLKQIAECIRYDKTFLIVVNDADAISYGYLYAKKIPLFNEEFVLMSITRHRIDTGLTYRINPPIVDANRPPSPAKFVRTPQPRAAERIKLAA